MRSKRNFKRVKVGEERRRGEKGLKFEINNINFK